MINWKKITTYSKMRVALSVEGTLTGNSRIIKQVWETRLIQMEACGE